MIIAFSNVFMTKIKDIVSYDLEARLRAGELGDAVRTVVDTTRNDLVQSILNSYRTNDGALSIDDIEIGIDTAKNNIAKSLAIFSDFYKKELVAMLKDESLSKLEKKDLCFRILPFLTEEDQKLLGASYEECRELIDSMKYGNFSDVFGVEKEAGKLNGIIAAVYQNVFETELYPSIEEKAANLLYFLIKDHPFVDGCKRIGASIFLEFLNKNKHLIIDGKQIISDSALVAITLMIAQSRPEEKETMVNLVMNFLKCEFCA